MKKLFILLLVMLYYLPSYSQEMEVLRQFRSEPDPMYGTAGKTVWASEHMRFVLNDNNTIELSIINPPHIFVEDRSSFTGQYKGYSNVRIGLFTANDSLLAIAEKWKAIPSEHGTILRIAGNGTFNRPNGEKLKGSIAHIYGTLLKREGSYVRIVCSVYGDYYFEVKATMKKQ